MNDLKFAIKWALIIAFCLFSTLLGTIWWRVKIKGEGFHFPGPGHLDFSVGLAGDYSLHRTSGINSIITPEAYNSGTPTIPTFVVECATDGRYILAKREDPYLPTPSSSERNAFVTLDY